MSKGFLVKGRNPGHSLQHETALGRVVGLGTKPKHSAFSSEHPQVTVFSAPQSGRETSPPQGSHQVACELPGPSAYLEVP